jgi:hypothetical protein
MDLRHLALILDAGRQAADAIEDAGLSAALSHMTEVAVGYLTDPDTFNVDTDFAERRAVELQGGAA